MIWYLLGAAGIGFGVWLALLKVVTPKVPLISLEGAHVLVTGGSSGIGLALGIRLAKQGAHVTIIARDVKKLKEAHQQIASAAKSKEQRILALPCDVSDWDAAQKAVGDACRANEGRLDVLVNNAGVSWPERFMETDIKNFDRHMRINYLGSVYMTRASVPFMAKNGGGRIIYVTSVLGLMGFTGYSGYCASKWAVHGMADSLEVELAHLNIHFSLCTPGNVDTPMYEEENKIKPEETKKIEGRVGLVKPDEVAARIEASLSHWSYIIPTHDMFGDTWLVAMLSGGVGTASFSELFWQSIVGGLLRPVAVKEVQNYKSVVRAHHGVKA